MIQLVEKALSSSLFLNQEFCEMEINSNGGDVVHGLHIVDIINKHPAHLRATVEKEAGSMAAIILQCAEVRRMRRTATLHYHYGSWRISFLVYFDKALAASNRKKAREYQKALIEPIVKRVGISEKEVHSLLRQDRRIGAEEALTLGLIDEII